MLADATGRGSGFRARGGIAATAFLLAVLAHGIFGSAAARATSWAQGPSGEGLSPLQLHAAYQLPFETPSAHAGMPPGSQPTVALIDGGSDPTLEENLGVYSETFGLPTCTESNGCLRVINKDGNPQPLPSGQPRAGETDLDVEAAHAICPTCHILVVEGDYGSDQKKLLKTTGEEVNAAVAAGATAISISNGELYASDTEENEEPYLEEIEREYFTHPGVVITVAAGDCGYNDKAFFSGLPNEIECGEEDPYYPASPSKFERIIAVGGTKLTEVGGVWKSKAWFDGGSGCATHVPTPPWQAALPEWSDAGCSGRAISDVSADSSCQTGPEIYVVHENPEEEWGVACGTSGASPMIAAEFALAGGARGRDRPAQTLYEHAGQSSAFYDVTEGLNGTECPHRIECHAGPGWDEPTGLGSPVGLSAFSLPGAPTNDAPPAISGSAQVGGTLTLEQGGWNGGPLTTFEEWQACDADGLGCVPIMGATAGTYIPTEDDLGKTIRVVQTAGNDSGYSPPAISAPTPIVTVAAPEGAPRGSNASSPAAPASPAPPPHARARPARADLSIPHRPLRLLPGGRVAVTLRCPPEATGGCRGAITIRSSTRVVKNDPRLLGHTRYRMRGGRTLQLRIRLRGFVRALLEREHHLPVTITESGSPEGTSVTRHVGLRLAD